MKRKRCKHCGRSFILTSRHPNQKYCSQKECQRTRKNNWQRRKLAKDEDYRINQAECWAKWASQHPGYWKRYREKHSAYVQRNKEIQRERNRINRGQPPVSPMISNVAKMDENRHEKPFVSGYYKLIPVTETPFTNMDPILVRIHEAALPGNPL